MCLERLVKGEEIKLDKKSDKVINPKPEGFSKLEVLKLGGCTSIGDTYLGKILASCKNSLKFIELNNLEKLSGEYTLRHLVEAPEL